MSKNAKWLRNSVLEMCVKYGTGSGIKCNINEFIANIKNNYDPLDWECAILYASKDQLLDAVKRSTSTRYSDQIKNPNNKKEKWELGSIGGARCKNINWLDVAKFKPIWWQDYIKFPHKGSINPSNFYKVVDQFRPIYNLFTNWLVADFSYSDLYIIWNLSTKVSSEEVNRCISLVTDNNKKNSKYLLAIIEQEQAIKRANFKEQSELNAYSLSVVNAILSIVDLNKDPVDWKPIDNNISEDKNNEDAFKDVKLT